jgi:hypothetical protein
MSTLHSSTVASSTIPTPAAPSATRVRQPGWRDPRLIAGVVVVALCVLIGARLLASADDTVAVWSLRHDVASGASIGRADLTVARVRLTGSVADLYVPASAAPAAGTTVTHALTAGELLPRSALSDGAVDALVEVPLSVAPDDVPASVGRGATVDVWVTPKVAGGDGRTRAHLALPGVVVLAVPAAGESLAPQTTRQVIVGVAEEDADLLSDALGELSDGRVVLTRRAGS